LETELGKDAGKVVRCFLIGHQDTHTRRIQKNCEGLFILPSERSTKEAGAEFGQHNEGQIDKPCPLDDLQRFRVSLAEIAIAIRIEEDLHRQIAGSI
jgi:hypothetical protein